MLSLIPRREGRDLNRFRDEVDRMFDRFLESWSSPGSPWEGKWFPSVDVSETEKEVIVQAEIPGIDAKDIDISVNGNRLTLQGERKQEEEKKGEHFHRIERSYGAFSRDIELPAQVDSDKVVATYKDGVLKVNLPKTKESATKKITVKAA